MPFPPPSSHLYLPSRLPRPSSSPSSHIHSNTPWPHSHPAYPSRPHSAPTSQERTTHPSDPNWPNLHSSFGPSTPRPDPTEYDSDFEPLPLPTDRSETHPAPLYPYPYFGSIPLITTSSSTSYDEEPVNEPPTPRPTQTSFLPSDLMLDPPALAPGHAALSERIRYRTHLQQRTLAFASSSPISPTSSVLSSETSADPYRSWPSPRRRPPPVPGSGPGGSAFVNATLPEAIRGYATHVRWLDDVYRVGGERSTRLVRGRDIVRDRDVFPGVKAAREENDGGRDVEEGDVLVCGGEEVRSVCAAGIEFFFPRLAPSPSEEYPPKHATDRPTPERGCDTPLFHHRSPQHQHHRPIELQTMDFLEILSDRATSTTEHAWVRERGWLVILPPSTDSSSSAYELTPGTESVTRVMGCGCLLQRSIVCLSCGNPLGHLLLKTCSRHTHPLSPLAPNTSGSSTLLFDAHAVRVLRRQRPAAHRSPAATVEQGVRSRTRTTSSSMTLVGADEDKWSFDEPTSVAEMLSARIGRRKGAVGR